ncbi:MAG: hypothetical protein U5K38_05275 [Woeseiaceae bacterium]|nr:hypothetical protein [Woeseiaceae bacterium]
MDQQPVWDTLAIAETVAERRPDAALWPDDAAARAHARSISAEMHSGFAALRAAMPMNCRAFGRRVSLPDDVTRDIDRIPTSGPIATSVTVPAGCSARASVLRTPCSHPSS